MSKCRICRREHACPGWPDGPCGKPRSGAKRNRRHLIGNPRAGWSPHWCPECDERRVVGLTASLDKIVREAKARANARAMVEGKP